jgi:hypothetical protein
MVRVVLLLVQLIQISNGIFYRSDCLLSGILQGLLVCLSSSTQQAAKSRIKMGAS